MFQIKVQGQNVPAEAVYEAFDALVASLRDAGSNAGPDSSVNGEVTGYEGATVLERAVADIDAEAAPKAVDAGSETPEGDEPS